MITLVGIEDGYEAIAAEFNCVIIGGLDYNFEHMPLAGSLVHTAMHASENVSVIVNSDVVLTQTLPDAIAHVSRRFENWFVEVIRMTKRVLLLMIMLFQQNRFKQ